MWWLFVLLGLVFSFAVLGFWKRRGKQAKRPRDGAARTSSVRQYTIRNGKSVRTDAVFDAWVSGNLEAMVKVLGKKSNPVDRHHLLNCIVEAAYRRRDEPAMLDLCVSTAETYLSEAPKLLKALADEMDGQMPRVPVYQIYATVLTHTGEFERAIQVCELAIESGLHDGTKGGFQGRIERIRKAQQKQLTS